MTTITLFNPFEVHAPFNRGDIVRLKSGGPTMTVKKSIQRQSQTTDEDTIYVHCLWFDAEGHVQTDQFEDWTLQGNT